MSISRIVDLDFVYCGVCPWRLMCEDKSRPESPADSTGGRNSGFESPRS